MAPFRTLTNRHAVIRKVRHPTVVLGSTQRDRDHQDGAGGTNRCGSGAATRRRGRGVPSTRTTTFGSRPGSPGRIRCGMRMWRRRGGMGRAPGGRPRWLRSAPASSSCTKGAPSPGRTEPGLLLGEGPGGSVRTRPQGDGCLAVAREGGSPLPYVCLHALGSPPAGRAPRRRRVFRGGARRGFGRTPQSASTTCGPSTRGSRRPRGGPLVVVHRLALEQVLTAACRLGSGPGASAHCGLTSPSLGCPLHFSPASPPRVRLLTPRAVVARTVPRGPALTPCRRRREHPLSVQLAGGVSAVPVAKRVRAGGKRGGCGC